MILPIFLKRGLVATLPILSDGEPAFTTDENVLYVGNGGTNIAFYSATSIDSLLNLKQSISEKGAINGYAGLDTNGKVPSSQLPAIAITDVFEVANEPAQLALTVQEGDIAIRSDLNKSYVHNGGLAGTMADWSELKSPTAAVLSVNGMTGAVTIDAADISDFQAAVSANADVVSLLVDQHSHANLALLNNIQVAYTTTMNNKLNSIEEGAEVNVQSDWDQTVNTEDDYIKNKPTTITAGQAAAIVANTATSHSHSNMSVLDAIEEAFTTILLAKLNGIEAGAQVNVQSDWNAGSGDTFIQNKPTTITAGQAAAIIANTSASHSHANIAILNAIQEAFTTALLNKLNGIEAGAEVNNISDVDALDLTDSGESTLHYHASDRNRANHTGTQLANTISDFNAAVALAIGNIDGGTF